MDIVLITGDADIDHPAFGVAILRRHLEAHGFTVGIIAQPQTDADYQVFGRPELFFGISSGNMDSMVNHYTAQRKIRSDDAYSPNNKTGLRPDRAVLIYTQKVKQLYKKIPVVIGGVEASMRRIPHYDFWSDKVRNSILFDSKADILVYGNGERQILAIAEESRKAKVESRKEKTNSTFDFLLSTSISGTCVLSKTVPTGAVNIIPDGFENVAGRDSFYQMTKTFTENYQNRVLYYQFGDRYLIHYPPAKPLSTAEIDAVYNQPFTRKPHPRYKGKFIKAYEQIKHSITSHRGCYGGCSFCMIGFHQGKTIQSRSKESILSEVAAICSPPLPPPALTGGAECVRYPPENRTPKTEHRTPNTTLTDLAGATANMYGTYCKAKLSETCPRRSCLCPEICPNLHYSEKPYLALLKAVRSSKMVKNVFISSGVRFDLALKQPEFINELCFFHTSGQLKLAPEHSSNKVLKLMNKPSIDKYLKFNEIYYDLCRKLEKKQFIIPYLIVGFPGTTLQDAQELADFLKKHKIKVEQVQEFTPTPMTIATMMYYTGLDYETGEEIYVPKGKEIRKQKEMIVKS